MPDLVSDALPGRDPPLCFVGDLHGRADLLEQLLAHLAQRDPSGRAEVVFLGDVIDRGPQSAAVLARLQRLCTGEGARYHCLMGNHERMLLEFLADPARHGARWLRNGGEATLASYGLVPRHSRDAAAEYARLAADLQSALPPGMAAWLAARPLFWREPGGFLRACHAGSDPARALEDQGEAELLWGRRPNPAAGPVAGIEIQGHIVVETAYLAQNRVWLDTGAWRTGRLSALWLGESAEWIALTAEGPAPL